MGKTAIILLLTLLALPVMALLFDRAPTPAQWQMLWVVVVEMLVFAGLCFVVSELSGNYSQVDKLWSITPPVYAWTICALAGMPDLLVLMSVLATIWGVRLTYNFSRHGAYSWKFWSGHEDYRWAHVRKNPALQGRWRFLLFNLLFISLYQHALLLLIVLPMLIVAATPAAIGGLDVVLALLLLALIVFETVADQQQWRFQSEKHRRLKAGEALSEAQARGFLDQGLWALSRHPNYFAEQAIWVVFFLFSVSASGRLNWSVAGCLLLIMLFRSSSELSESISAGKYPAYARYQQQVPRFWPRLRARRS